MPFDAYAKFGDDDDDPTSEIPLIPGDSDDEDHFWWCELRDCGIDLTVRDQGSERETDSAEHKKSNPSFGHVTLKKRVDWASTQLVMMCCHAGTAKIEKEEDAECEIKALTVHVCRTIQAKNLPFVIITYKGVRIVSYTIDMSGPEPAETIEFEFKKLDFEYRQTSPYSGSETGKRLTKHNLHNHHDALGKSGAALTKSPAPASGNGNHDGNSHTGSEGSGGPPPPPSPNQVPAVQNFPGLKQENGSGLLPH